MFEECQTAQNGVILSGISLFSSYNLFNFTWYGLEARFLRCIFSPLGRRKAIYRTDTLDPSKKKYCHMVIPMLSQSVFEKLVMMLFGNDIAVQLCYFLSPTLSIKNFIDQKFGPLRPSDFTFEITFPFWGAKLSHCEIINCIAVQSRSLAVHRFPFEKKKHSNRKVS